MWNFMKIRPVEAEMLHADGRKIRHHESNSLFSLKSMLLPHRLSLSVLYESLTAIIFLPNTYFSSQTDRVYCAVRTES